MSASPIRPGPFPELVPRPLWGHSAARLLPSAKWRAVRAEVVRAAGSACAHCGVRRDKGMVCHEVWSYDTDQAVATLRALRLQCRACDAAVHYGLALQRGQRAAAAARSQLQRVTGLSAHDIQVLLEHAFEQWAYRNGIVGWEVAVDQRLLDRFPTLAAIQGPARGTLG